MLGLVTDVSKCLSEGRWRRETWNNPQMSTDCTWQCLAVWSDKYILPTSGWAKPMWTHIQKNNKPTWSFLWALSSFFPTQLHFLLLIWRLFTVYPRELARSVDLLSFGNIRLCLLRESEGLFVSLKISHTFDHDCASLSPPPWSVHLRDGGKEDVHRETRGKTVVYGAWCLLSGDERAKKRNITLNAFYQEMKSKGKRIPY